MNDLDFYKSFRFTKITFRGSRHTDNGAGCRTHYFGYMYEGEGRLLSDDGEITVKKGDLFYIPFGCRYHSYWRGSDEVVFASIAFCFLPSARRGSFRLSKIPQSGGEAEIINEIMRNPVVNAENVARVYALAAMCENEMEFKDAARRGSVAVRAAEYLKKKPDSRISEVAAACGVGETTLYAAFREEFQKTPNAVRREILCERACELLAATNLPIEEISERLSFSSSSYFRKIFYSVTGKTPSGYRKENSAI